MSSARLLADLHAAVPLIGPSLLACDSANLQTEIRRVEKAGARILHLDVMDGNFVPNMSFGLPIVEAIRRVTNLPLDVHLMISQPDRYLERYRWAGADLMTIHVEAPGDTRSMLQEIRSLGAAAGITLNPHTPVSEIEGFLDACDLVLVMSVEAGFGGQEFEPLALEKLRRVRALAGPDMLLSVDGGINLETVGLCAAAGADLFVVGSFLFSHHDYGPCITQLRELARAEKDVRV
jgi:ribulose-phosphate 3-epimerase